MTYTGLERSADQPILIARLDVHITADDLRALQTDLLAQRDLPSDFVVVIHDVTTVSTTFRDVLDAARFLASEFRPLPGVSDQLIIIVGTQPLLRLFMDFARSTPFLRDRVVITPTMESSFEVANIALDRRRLAPRS